jgi:hypothetical protein
MQFFFEVLILNSFRHWAPHFPTSTAATLSHCWSRHLVPSKRDICGVKIVVMSLLYGHLSGWSWFGVNILCLLRPFARFMAKEIVILCIFFCQILPFILTNPTFGPFQKLCPNLASRVGAREEGSQHVQFSAICTGAESSGQILKIVFWSGQMWD